MSKECLQNNEGNANKKFGTGKYKQFTEEKQMLILNKYPLIQISKVETV